jgi:hypothetical protein
MKTFFELREDTNSNKWGWSWRAKGSPYAKADKKEKEAQVQGFGGREDHNHGKKGVEAIIDFGTTGQAGVFIEQGYHYSDVMELAGSSLSWGEVESNSKGEDDRKGTYVTILGTPDEIMELFTNRKGWGIKYTKHIPKSEVKRAIAKGKKFKFPNSP